MTCDCRVVEGSIQRLGKWVLSFQKLRLDIVLDGICDRKQKCLGVFCERFRAACSFVLIGNPFDDCPVEGFGDEEEILQFLPTMNVSVVTECLQLFEFCRDLRI